MISDFIEIEKNEDGHVSVEIFDDGTFIFRNFDEEAEAVLVELGFDPSISYRAWHAIVLDDIDMTMLDMVREGHIGAIRVLLFAGGDPRAYRNALINTAAQHGHHDIVMLLMDYGASPMLDRWAALDVASSGRLDLIELFLHVGAFRGMYKDAVSAARRLGHTQAADMIASKWKSV